MLNAIRREYQKMGKTLTVGELNSVEPVVRRAGVRG
jgi:hypothetical protein